MLSTQLSAERLDLTLDEVIARLPTLYVPVDAAALNDYLDTLYTLGRLRHIPNISPQNVVYLHGLLCQNQPKNILEIGCGTGQITKLVVIMNVPNTFITCNGLSFNIKYWNYSTVFLYNVDCCI